MVLYCFAILCVDLVMCASCLVMFAALRVLTWFRLLVMCAACFADFGFDMAVFVLI